MSFATVLGTAFLLLVSLILSAALAAMGKWYGNLLPVPEAVLQIVNFLLSFAVITGLFAMIFKILPEAHIAWPDVWMGAAITSFLFTIGKFAIGLYLGKSQVASGFGAAGSLVVMLVWVYYYAHTPNGGTYWGGNSMLCVSNRSFADSQSFKRSNDACPGDARLEGFKRMDTNAADHTVTLH